MLWVAVPCLIQVLAAGPLVTAACNDPPPLRYEPRTFLGYACERDCERHKAGFGWAEQHSVTDPRWCASLPHAEAEGCIAYTDEGWDAVGAGSRWAVENEIVLRCQCAGAGERFRVGCARALDNPAGQPQ